MVAEFDNNDSPASCLLPAVAASEATKPVSDTILSRDEQDYLEAHLDHEVAPTFNGTSLALGVVKALLCPLQ